MNVSLKVWEELITQSRYTIKDARQPTCPSGIHHSISRMHFVQPSQKWLSSTTWKFFEKCPNTPKKSHAHLQCVHNNCARLEECQKNVRILPKSHMHIFNVSITTVQGLMNVSLKAWEELITQSTCRLFKTCWNKHSDSIASNTKSPTGGIFHQNSSTRTKLNFDF